jgi:pyruvate/2-oxoglutarate dehydrogenase complex dihydrolipoamide dehydrogenase (E3) component
MDTVDAAFGIADAIGRMVSLHEHGEDQDGEGPVVIGGGPVGVEMAQAHRRLGCEVTIIEAASLLGRDDPELTRVVVDRLAQEGVAIRDMTTVASVSHDSQGFHVELGDGTSIAGSHLLVAAGRRPNIDGLNLAAAGVAVTAKGITVDKRLRTTNPPIYAIGDCNGGPQFTHSAGHQAGLVIRHALFRLPVNAASVVTPHVTYSDPELAQAGLTESEARAQFGKAITVLRRNFAANDRAVAEADTQGLIKVIAGRRGRILGVGIVGAQAGELIQPWLLAMNNGLSLRAMLATLPPYPTRGEAGRQAAFDYFGAVASNPWLRRVIRLMGRFG